MIKEREFKTTEELISHYIEVRSRIMSSEKPSIIQINRNENANESFKNSYNTLLNQKNLSTSESMMAGAGKLKQANHFPQSYQKPEAYQKKDGQAQIKISDIRNIVLGITNMQKHFFNSERRSAPVVKARHISFWVTRRFTSASYPQIGRMLGGRDHTTVLHGCRRVNRLLTSIPTPESDDPISWVTNLWQADWALIENAKGNQECALNNLAINELAINERAMNERAMNELAINI